MQSIKNFFHEVKNAPTVHEKPSLEVCLVFDRTPSMKEYHQFVALKADELAQAWKKSFPKAVSVSALEIGQERISTPFVSEWKVKDQNEDALKPYLTELSARMTQPSYDPGGIEPVFDAAFNCTKQFKSQIDVDKKDQTTRLILVLTDESGYFIDKSPTLRRIQGELRAADAHLRIINPRELLCPNLLAEDQTVAQKLALIKQMPDDQMHDCVFSVLSFFDWYGGDPLVKADPELLRRPYLGAIARLKDTNEMSRLAAIELLGRTADPALKGALLKAVKKAPEKVRTRLTQALEPQHLRLETTEVAEAAVDLAEIVIGDDKKTAKQILAILALKLKDEVKVQRLFASHLKDDSDIGVLTYEYLTEAKLKPNDLETQLILVNQGVYGLTFLANSKPTLAPATIEILKKHLTTSPDPKIQAQAGLALVEPAKSDKALQEFIFALAKDDETGSIARDTLFNCCRSIDKFRDFLINYSTFNP